MIVRPARGDDRDALAVLWRELDLLHARIAPAFFRPTLDGGHARASVGRAIADAEGGHDRTLLVAEEVDAVVAGFAHVVIYDTPASPERRPRRRARVEELVVLPAHRRRGIARALMDASATWSRGRGAEQLLLTVWEGNDEAEGLYRALGYSPVSQVLGIEIKR